MAGPGGVGVVDVVPAVAEGHHGQRPEVGAPILGPIRPPAEGVAQGVDRPGHVVQERHPHQTGPQQGAQRPAQGAGQQIADPEGDGQGRCCQQREEPIDPPDVAVPQHVGRVAGRAGGVRHEEPADVGERQPPQEGDAVVAVAVGGVGVPGMIAVHVVAPVGGHPAGQGALHGHGAQDGQGDLEGPARSEAAVGEQAVEPDRDPEAGEEVEDQGDDEVREVDGVSPQHGDEHGQGQCRSDHDGHRDQLLSGTDHDGFLLRREAGVERGHRLGGYQHGRHGTSEAGAGAPGHLMHRLARRPQGVM